MISFCIFATFYNSQAEADKFSYLGNNDQSSPATVVNDVTAAGIVGITRELIRGHVLCSKICLGLKQPRCMKRAE